MKNKPSPPQIDEDPDFEETEDEDEEDGDQLLCSTCEAKFEKRVAQCPHCGAWSTIKTRDEIDAETAENEDPDSGGSDDDEDEDEDEDDDSLDLSPSIESMSMKKIDFLRGSPSWIVSSGAVPCWEGLRFGGDPGVGKSTLLLQALAGLSTRGTRCLYVSGEEAASQVSLRGKRIAENCPGGMNPDNLLLLADTRTEKIIKALIQVQPEVAVIDSIQTIHTKEGNAGDISQLLKNTSLIIAVAQKYKIATFLVGHITMTEIRCLPKKPLEHLVDTVLIFRR